jgi:hypothetical protein
MDINSLKPWIEVIASLSALIIGLVTALWVYTKFVVERGLLPPVQFGVDCRPMGHQGEKMLIEIAVHMKNMGTSNLIATDIRVDIRYLEQGPTPELLTDPEPGLFGRVRFPGSVSKDLLKTAGLDAPPPLRGKMRAANESSGKPKRPRGFSVMPYDTFVQPQVDQAYTFATTVPRSASHVLVWSSFRYAQRPKALQKVVLWVSRRLGLIQFTLEHATKAHTTERVFALESSDATA